MTINLIKKISLPIIFFILLFGQGINFAQAEAYNFAEDSGLKNMAEKAEYDVNNTQDPEVYIGQYLTLLFSFLGVIILALVVYGGIIWMTAQGNTSEIQKAQSIIKNSIIGLVIIALSYALTYFVVSNFYRDNTNNSPTMPADYYYNDISPDTIINNAV